MMKKRFTLKSIYKHKKNKIISNKIFLLIIFTISLSLPILIAQAHNYGKNDYGDEKKLDSREKKHLQLFSERQKPILLSLIKQSAIKDAAIKSSNICADLKGSKFRESQHCYSEVFYFIAKKNNQKFAYDTIDYLSQNDNSTKPCHLMAHGIGRGVYDKDPANWQNAIGRANSECSYGEIHGILEGYGSSGNNPFDRKKLTTICAKNETAICYHGLGHVLLANFGNNLSKTADLCYVFSKKQYKDSCLNGVFMEHMIGGSLEEHGLITAERRKKFYDYIDEFEELCKSQTKDDYIRACWFETIHASVSKFNGDAEKVYALCEKAQTADASRGCRLHAIAELVPRNDYDPFKSEYICKISMTNDPNFEKNCYDMLVSVIMANSPSKIDIVSNFCISLDPGNKEVCNKAIKRHTAILRKQNPEKANNICKNVSSEFKSVCSGKNEEITTKM